MNRRAKLVLLLVGLVVALFVGLSVILESDEDAIKRVTNSCRIAFLDNDAEGVLEHLAADAVYGQGVREEDLSSISGILSKYGISIESVIQKGRKQTGPVSIVMRTHSARESSVRKALAEIDALDVVASETVKIRILEEDE